MYRKDEKEREVEGEGEKNYHHTYFVSTDEETYRGVQAF